MAVLIKRQVVVFSAVAYFLSCFISMSTARYPPMSIVHDFYNRTISCTMSAVPILRTLNVVYTFHLNSSHFAFTFVVHPPYRNGICNLNTGLINDLYNYTNQSHDRELGGIDIDPDSHYALGCTNIATGQHNYAIAVHVSWGHSTIFESGPWTCNVLAYSSRPAFTTMIGSLRRTSGASPMYDLPSVRPLKSQIFMKRDDTYVYTLVCANPDYYLYENNDVAIMNVMDIVPVSMTGDDADGIRRLAVYAELFKRHRLTYFDDDGSNNNNNNDSVFDVLNWEKDPCPNTTEQRLTWSISNDTLTPYNWPLEKRKHSLSGHSRDHDADFSSVHVLNTCPLSGIPTTIASSTYRLKDIKKMLTNYDNLTIHCSMFGIRTPYRKLGDMYANMLCGDNKTTTPPTMTRRERKLLPPVIIRVRKTHDDVVVSCYVPSMCFHTTTVRIEHKYNRKIPPLTLPTNIYTGAMTPDDIGHMKSDTTTLVKVYAVFNETEIYPLTKRNSRVLCTYGKYVHSHWYTVMLGLPIVYASRFENLVSNETTRQLLGGEDDGDIDTDDDDDYDDDDDEVAVDITTPGNNIANSTDEVPHKFTETLTDNNHDDDDDDNDDEVAANTTPGDNIVNSTDEVPPKFAEALMDNNHDDDDDDDYDNHYARFTFRYRRILYARYR